MGNINMICIYCNSSKVYVVQIRKNKGLEKSIYKCRECERRFTPDNGFKKHRYPPTVIKPALELLKQGSSLAEVSYYINQSFRINITRKTILDWKRKFAIYPINVHKQKF